MRRIRALLSTILPLLVLGIGGGSRAAHVPARIALPAVAPSPVATLVALVSISAPRPDLPPPPIDAAGDDMQVRERDDVRLTWPTPRVPRTAPRIAAVGEMEPDQSRVQGIELSHLEFASVLAAAIGGPPELRSTVPPPDRL